MNKTILLLSQSRFYWTLRNFWRASSYRFSRSNFNVRTEVEDKREEYSTLQTLFAAAQYPVLGSLATVAILELVDHIISSHLLKIGIALPGKSDYITFLSAVAGICGVFIGLYYAGIASVGAAIYNSVPNDIRGLLAQERKGTVYMRFLSFLAFLCLASIACTLTGRQPLYGVIAVVTISSGIGIFAFVSLGRDAFNLFDPTALSISVFENLHKSVRDVKVGSFKWTDPLFQNHAHTNASLAIDTLDALAEMTTKGSHLSGKPFINLCRNILYFLSAYLHIKNKIPANSRWHTTKYKHADWYRSETQKISLAHKTGTAIEPVEVRDVLWLENRLHHIVVKCFEVNLHAKRFQDLSPLLTSVDSYLQKVSSIGRADIAVSFFKDIGNVVSSSVDETPEIVGTAEHLYQLSIFEQLASLPISIALRHGKWMEEWSKDNLSNKLEKVDWSSLNSVYSAGFPSICLEQMEWLQPRLVFEKKVEGRYVTPIKYQTALLLKPLTEQFITNSVNVCSDVSDYYSSLIKPLLERKKPWFAAAIISREWEYIHKLSYQSQLQISRWDDLISLKSYVSLEWPDFSLQNQHLKLKERKRNLLKQMSQLQVLLQLEKRPDGYPDYAGQFLHSTGEAAFDALLENDHALFKSLLELYFTGCTILYERLRPTSGPKWRLEIDTKIAISPLIDLMDLCGYAKLIDGFHENTECWKSVVEIWDRIKADQKPQFFQLMVAALQITEMSFEIAYRSQFRFEWSRKIQNLLITVPRHAVNLSRGFFSPDSVVIDHPDQLVRIFAQETHHDYDGISIFIAEYLRKVPEFEKIDFGYKHTSLQEQLDREEQADLDDDDD